MALDPTRLFFYSLGCDLEKMYVPHTAEEEQNHSGISTSFALLKTYPNPFNTTLNIQVTLPEAASLRVSITNILGREVALLSDQTRQAGYHHFVFDGSELSSGIYFVHAKVDGKMDQVQKVILMK